MKNNQKSIHLERNKNLINKTIIKETQDSIFECFYDGWQKSQQKKKQNCFDCDKKNSKFGSLFAFRSTCYSIIVWIFESSYLIKLDIILNFHYMYDKKRIVMNKAI